MKPIAFAVLVAVVAPSALAESAPLSFGEQEMNFDFWPDAKAKGLAMRPANLLHWAEGPCSGPATIPMETLRRLGFDPRLIEDIATGRYQVADP